MNLPCKARGRPTPTVTWRKAFSHLPKGKSAVVDGNLTILSVTKADSGTYACSAKNLLREVSAVATLMVTDRLKFTLNSPLKVQARTFSDLMLTCEAQGTTMIVWKRAGQSLPQNHAVYRNGTLLLRNFSSNDAGSYTCVAKNAKRSIEATSVVESKYPLSATRVSTSYK